MRLISRIITLVFVLVLPLAACAPRSAPAATTSREATSSQEAVDTSGREAIDTSSEQTAASAPVRPQQSLLLGVARLDLPGDLGVVERYEQESGKRLGILHWYAAWAGDNREFDPAPLEKIAARGAIPLISWEPWAGHKDDPTWTLQDAILSGRNDTYIESWASGLAAFGRPVLLRFAQKMHDSAYPWSTTINGNTPEEYVAAWRHVREVFARQSATNVQWVWAPNTLASATAAAYEPIYRAHYPGDDQVDLIGLDVYNTGTAAEHGGLGWRSFADILAEPYRAITSVSGKPLLITEVGSIDRGGEKPFWIADALGADLPVRFPQVIGVVWFDWDREGQWELRSSPAAYEAFLDAWRLPHFREGP